MRGLILTKKSRFLNMALLLIHQFERNLKNTMVNSKKDNLVKFIQGISNEKIIGVIEEILDSSMFTEKIAEKTGLMPIWVVFDIHISMQGNRYRTSIKKAFRNKKGLADFLLSEALSGKVPVYETEVVFIEQDLKKIFYATRKNGLGYYNYDHCFSSEVNTTPSSGENTMIEYALIV